MTTFELSSKFGGTVSIAIVKEDQNIKKLENSFIGGIWVNRRPKVSHLWLRLGRRRSMQPKAEGLAEG